MTETPKRVDYEMRYIGWNMGATRVERHETKGDIELLELTIDGVDILKQLEKAEKYDGEHKAAMIVENELRKIDNKLEAVKKQLFVVPSIHVQDYQRMMRKIKKILEAEG